MATVWDFVASRRCCDLISFVWALCVILYIFIFYFITLGNQHYVVGAACRSTDVESFSLVAIPGDISLATRTKVKWRRHHRCQSSIRPIIRGTCSRRSASLSTPSATNMMSSRRPFLQALTIQLPANCYNRVASSESVIQFMLYERSAYGRSWYCKIYEVSPEIMANTVRGAQGRVWWFPPSLQEELVQLEKDITTNQYNPRQDLITCLNTISKTSA